MRGVILTGDGEVKTKEIEEPVLLDKGIVSETRYSLISSGTEISAINMRKAGIVSNQLKLGYANAGVVLEGGKGCSGFAIGDRVASAGWEMAIHAEKVSIPKNLCVKVPDNVGDDEAAFTAVGAICLHAVRRCGIEFGQNIAILGQGLLGQLCSQLARVAGARTIVTAKYPLQQKLSKDMGADLVLSPKDDVESKIEDFTNHLGADSVIISIGGDMSKPFKLAAKIIRDRGNIVLLGRGNLSFNDDEIYTKEITILQTRSQGPGKYDPMYEKEGIDYPIGYVRWTENGNMEEFLRLIGEGKIDVKSLITHQFSLDEAPKAYETIMRDKGKVMAVLFNMTKNS